MGQYEDQVIANTKAIKQINNNAKKPGDLPIFNGVLNSKDIIPLEIKSSGQVVGSKIEQLINDGIGTSSIKIDIGISFDFPLNNKTDIEGIHGAIYHSTQSGIILNSGQNITSSKGQSKILISVNAGSVLTGTLSITGIKVDIDTGVETLNYTEDISIDGLTVDTSSLDSNNNHMHGLSNAYCSTNLFKGDLVFSSADLDLTDIEFSQISYEQFNNIDNIEIDAFDFTYVTNNTEAVMDAYLYAVKLNGNILTVSNIASVRHETGQEIAYYRKKIKGIAEELNCNTDGIFLDLYLAPSNQAYFENFTNKIWVATTKKINVIVDGSLGLDNITYGETLQVGDLVYLKTDGKYYKADNTSELKSTTELRLILTVGNLDDEIIALAKGQYTGIGFTAGNEYVGTSGTITSTRPILATETVRIVSTAINATTRYFDASKTWINGDASKINGVALPGLSNEFLDNVFTLLNSDNQTKKAQFLLDLLLTDTSYKYRLQGKNGTLAHLDDIAILSGLIAENILVDTSGFDNNLSAADDTVQKALQTFNDTVIGDLANPVRIEMGVSNNINWISPNGVFLKTMTSDAIFTDSNLPVLTNTKKINLYLDGIFNPEFPDYWINIGGVFDNSKLNKISAEVINGISGNELVYYTISQQSLDKTWNISYMSNLKSYQFNDGGDNFGAMQGMHISNNGTKLYIMESVGDKLHEYTLSIAWELNTASFIQSLVMSAYSSLPQGIHFKHDGTRMYMTSERGTGSHQWDLSIPWDTSSATYVSAKDWSDQGLMQHLWFKPDGTKVYTSSAANKFIYEYNCSTAWDITTTTLVQSLDLTSLESAIYQFYLRSDGLKLYFAIDTTTDRIYEYDLSIAWDISTATETRDKVVSSGSTRGTFWNPNGLQIFHLQTPYINSYDIN